MSTRTRTSKTAVPAQNVAVEDIQVALEIITPDVAEEMLAANIGNRKIREEAVDLYARDMAEGRWRLTGDALRFATDGSLLDGQHRLTAIVKAGVPVETFVFRNVPVAAKPAIDTGVKRTVADYLSWAGESDPFILASSVRLAIGIERNGGSAMARRVIVSPEEVYQYCEAHPKLRDAARVSGKLKTIKLTPAVRAYCFWRLAEVDEEKAYEFYYALAEREGLYRGDPRHVLARRLEQSKLSRQRLSAVVQVSLVFRAWNAWRKGEQLAFLRVNSSAGGDVPIPRPI